MIKKLKYIRFETGFVVFAEPMTHKEIKFTESSFGINEKPISAGFFSFFSLSPILLSNAMANQFL